MSDPILKATNITMLHVEHVFLETLFSLTAYRSNDFYFPIYGALSQWKDDLVIEA